MAEWGRIRSRGNVEDRRSFGPAITGGLSLTGILIYLLFSFLTDGQVEIPIEQLENITATQQQNITSEEFEGQDSYEIFASTVLGSNNDMWNDLFSKANLEYIPPKLVLFRTATQSACGTATSQVGPFYCPLDQTIYLDETFFDVLTSRFDTQGGDVAEAYVIAHEVAHHAQNGLGIMDSVLDESNRNRRISNDLSVKLELQADCFAGLWAYSIKDLEVFGPGEISEAIDAAAAVGDDRIQESVTGRINPETWTHGSAEQRVGWFTRGYETGSLESCNTF